MTDAPRGGRTRALLRGAVVDITPFREHPRFRRLMGGQLGTNLGRHILVVAIPYELFVLTGSTLLVGLAGLISAGSLILCSFVGGSLADAFDRGRLLVAVSAAMTLTCIGLAVNAGTEESVALILVLVALESAAIAVEGPARSSLIPAVVPRHQVTGAFALHSTLGQTMQIAGPAVGGLLIARFGLVVVYAIAALAHAGAGITRLGLGPVPTEGASGRVTVRAVLEGWRYLVSKPVLAQIMALDVVAMVFGLPRALFPLIGTVVLGGDASTVGLLHAAPAVGALAAALTAGWVSYVRHQGRAIVAAVVGYGLAIIAFGFTRSLWPALAFLALAGVADLISTVFRSSMQQLSVPDPLRGRVSAVKVALSGAAPRFGDAEAAAVAQVVSPMFSVVSGGLLSIVGALTIAWRGRTLWGHVVDVQDEPDGPR